MIALGVWACRYREMKPISFPTLPSLRDRNKDAGGNGGTYEMVAQKDEENLK